MDKQVDPYLAKATRPGSAFEIGEREGLRQFVNAPPDLNMLIESARAHGDKTFVVEGERRITFADMFSWRDRLVPLLGIARGDRVAICMRNRAEWLVAFLAIVRAGGVAVLLNSRGAPAELVGMIGEVDPVLVLADSERAALIREGGYEGRMMALTRPIDDLEIDARIADAPPPDLGPANPDDPVAILFSSGTTGHVKGAVLSHRNLITGLMSVQLSGAMILLRTAEQYGMEVDRLIAQIPQQAVLLVYPLFHISGLGSAFLAPLLTGTKVVIMRRWDAQDALKLIAEERITMFTAVPTMLWDVLHNAKVADADLSSLTNVASGGQALPVNLLHEMRATCPQAAMGTGYGMTECSGAVAQSVGEDFVRKPASAGRVLPLVDMRILGPDGEELPRGETGTISVRGAMVMKGYWNRPEETAAALSEDGWLDTGDVGYIDEEGYVFIVDRKKDMVISGGENIYCAEVERVMGEMPGVTECAAFGISDERLGEALVAVVVTNDLSEDDIRDAVAAKLAKYKAPMRVAITQETLPRNHVGKADKITLRKAWPDLIGE
jgi:acyl-CoA synthetase (AMP-forming)/AMP-acid ligase II